MNRQPQKIRLKNFFIGDKQRLVLISGPCVIESEEHTLHCAWALKKMTASLGMPLIFKASYDKANRSSYNSFRGPGIEEGLRILELVRSECDLPITTDIHSPEEARAAGEVCDILQIPAFLCRQTDLVTAAADTGKIVNVKKGQFLAPWDMKNVVDKIEAQGNKQIILTDRGTTFGYNNLVSDMRGIPIMQSLGYPVCFDASHSVQLPGGQGTSSGGQREFIPTLAKAAVASGCDMLFIESHPDPKSAKSDKDSVMPYDTLEKLLKEVSALNDLVRNFS